MAIQGTLKTMNLTDLLQFLAAGRKTGTLKFDSARITKQVYFENGMIVGSKSNDPREYLGQVLLHYGKVDEIQLQAARERQRTSGQRLGEVLVELGFTSEDDVLAILKTRTLDAIYDLFMWTEGEFEFYDEEPLPADLVRIEVEPTTVIMEGIYRIDELTRYHSLLPSERAVLEPTRSPSLPDLSEEAREILGLIEKRMSVAEICYNMHASSFHVFGQVYDLIQKGVTRVVGELPEPAKLQPPDVAETPESSAMLLESARKQLDKNPEMALEIIQGVLQLEPQNTEAHALLPTAEAKFIEWAYQSGIPPNAVPRVLLSAELTDEQFGPQEGFVLSRINGEWNVESILSICPFRDADCLRMMKKLIDRGIIGL
ncbi:MAG: DUF4388 domain-containing protein [Pyrinomonadaceae bacterium]